MAAMEMIVKNKGQITWVEPASNITEDEQDEQVTDHITKLVILETVVCRAGSLVCRLLCVSCVLLSPYSLGRLH